MSLNHTSLSGLFTAIANAIRAKTGSSSQIVADDFPTEIANIPTGTTLPTLTTPASEEDIAEGKEAIDEDGEIITGTKYDWLKDIKFNSNPAGIWENANTFSSDELVLNLPAAETLYKLFNRAIFQSGTSLEINAPNATNLYYLVACNSATSDSGLRTLTLNVDWSKVTNIGGLCYYNYKLGAISPEIDLSNISTDPSIAPFAGTTDLKRIRFVPNTIQINLSFNSSASLQNGSIISIANGLKDGVTGKTLTLHATPKAATLTIMGTVSQVTEDNVTYNFFTKDSGGSTSLNSFITQTKGWTLA